MNKYIVAFDVETTGLSFKNDYIIQLAAVKFDADFNIIGSIKHLVKPVLEFTITDEAFGKHGITKETVLREGVPLADVATEFLQFTDGCDILSYNGHKFDVRMLSKDFASVGLEFSLDRVFYDSMVLETKLMPRTLSAVYKRYTGNELVDSHDAMSDVMATIEVFKHQVQAFNAQNVTLDDIMQFDESKLFCIDGMIKLDGMNIVFAKGKYINEEFMSVARKDVGYIKWFMSNPEFDITTKRTLQKYYADRKNK